MRQNTNSLKSRLFISWPRLKVSTSLKRSTVLKVVQPDASTTYKR